MSLGQRQANNPLTVSSFFCLLIRCPLGRGKSGCPFCEFRKGRSLEKKFEIAQNLANGDGADMMLRHKDCFLKRMRKLRITT